ncbi:MAG: ABC transporter ATP-binding protein [Eubacteriales bacterium]|nr:ABC transporter ATP-binding protein [Eubacteriales bacterium]
MTTILEFKNYRMAFKDDEGVEHNLLDDLSIKIEENKALGIVGESGCGKSMTSLSIMRLLPPAATAQSGEILFRGEDLLKKTDDEMKNIRGNDISMIFQEPMTALNPVMKIGRQISEAVLLHDPKLSKKEAKARAIEVLERVSIPNATDRYNHYPHEFSGGMRQRAMIAMAIVNQPDLLIADEPTTALDVTIQAQILDIMKQLINESDGSLLMITHNLGIIADICDEVVVMYAGQAVERGTVKAIFDAPKHPYTCGLMKAIPTTKSEKTPLYTIPGTVPTVFQFQPGCRFVDRCADATKLCRQQRPPLSQVSEDHLVHCWKFAEGEELSC